MARKGICWDKAGLRLRAKARTMIRVRAWARVSSKCEAWAKAKS